MKTLTILLIVCFGISFPTVAQKTNKNTIPQRDSRDLFKGDTVILYIGIENRFKTNPNEKLSLEKETKGIRIKNVPGLISITPVYPGIFKINFKTPLGNQSVIFQSKPVPPKEISNTL